jgi:DNA-binding beta-propeller fold protein YncE
VSPDRSKVYVGVFHSGNQTTVLESDIENGGLDKPPPKVSSDGQPQPRTGLIVKYNGEHWRDNGDPTTRVDGSIWDERVRFSLPDNDLFSIDATANPPVRLASASGVGTTLFNIAVNPTNGKLYVSNTESLNHIRFEGPGTNSTTVRGHFIESRVTVVTSNKVKPRHLNKHISSYQQDLGTADENQRSLATPTGMAISANGDTLYVAAFGSSRVGIFATAELESDSFVTDTSRQIAVTGGGPSGLVLDEARQLLCDDAF